MKLGLLSAILPEMNFRQVVNYCKKVGFEAIEVACWPSEGVARRYAGVTHLHIGEWSVQKLKEELDYARKQTIDISAFAYYPNPLSADEKESRRAIDHIMLLIETAAETGVGQVNTFIGKDKNKTTEENLLLFKEIWTPILRFAETKKVKIAIENCPMYFSKDEWPGGNNLAHSPTIWREMFHMIDSPYFGLNYDPSHQVIQGMDYLKPIYEFRDKIFHIHFKDVHIMQDQLDSCGRFAYPLEYMSPKIPGLGDIDWSAFCRALYDIGYEDYACVEIEDKNFESTPEHVKHGIDIAYKNIRNYI